jgi:hypothetical protein
MSRYATEPATDFARSPEGRGGESRTSPIGSSPACSLSSTSRVHLGSGDRRIGLNITLILVAAVTVGLATTWL